MTLFVLNIIVYFHPFRNPPNVSCCVKNIIKLQKQPLKGVHVLIGYVAKLKFIMQIVVISFTKRYLMRLNKSAKRVAGYVSTTCGDLSFAKVII